MIHRYAPVQLLVLSPILYLTVQKGTPTSAGPLKVRGPIWSNRSNRPKTGPDSNDANTKKKTVRNCDIIHIKIKSFLYSRELHQSVNEMAGPTSVTLRLGTGQHSKMIYDQQISDIAK